MHIYERILAELTEHFKVIDRRFGLLRNIDAQIVHDDVPLAGFFAKVAEDLRVLFQVKRASAFIVLEDRWLPVPTTASPEFQILRYTPDFGPGRVIANEVFLRRDWPAPDLNTNLFIPVKLHEEVVVLIVVQDETPKGQESMLGAEDTKTYAQDVANQVAIMLKHRSGVQLAASKDNLVETFLKDQLMPHRCWRAMVDHAASFLPNWEPLKLPSPPRVQVLTYNKRDRFMLLRATQHVEPEEDFKENVVTTVAQSVPLKVEDTVCGALLEKNLEVLHVNPRVEVEYKKRYKAFLFGAGHPESELVLPIRQNGEIVGLLNLEHQSPKVFTNYHIALMQEVAGLLGPFITALVLEEKRERENRISLMYVMNHLLGRLAWTYQHKTGQLYVKSIGRMDMLRDALAAKSADAPEHLSKLAVLVKDLQLKTNAFLKDVPDYVQNKRVDVGEEIQAARRDFDADARVQNHDVVVEFTKPEKAYQVFASHLLREHIYNIISNSCDAIRDSLAAKKIPQGKVVVSVSRELVADNNQNVTSTPQVIVRITDNGGGVKPELLHEIVKCGFSTKRAQGGTGCGLTAAIDYMREVGGNLELKNQYGSGLTVELVLQEFVPEYHQLLVEKKSGEERNDT